jgi:hypothetical protein
MVASPTAKVVRTCSSGQAGPEASALSKIQARLIFRAAALPWLTRDSNPCRSSSVSLTTYFFLFIAIVFLLGINETIPRVGLAANLSINHGQGTSTLSIEK